MKNRAFTAGVTLGKSIIEMVHLMYQKNTACNFLKGLVETLLDEYNKRKSEKEKS